MNYSIENALKCMEEIEKFNRRRGMFKNGKNYKLSVKERGPMRKIIKAGIKEGQGYIKIASILNAKGFKTPNGLACDRNFVSNQVYTMKHTKIRKKQYEARPRTTFY